LHADILDINSHKEKEFLKTKAYYDDVAFFEELFSSGTPQLFLRNMEVDVSFTLESLLLLHWSFMKSMRFQSLITREILASSFLARGCEFKILEYWLNNTSFEPNGRNSMGKTLLHFACSYGSPNAIQRLIKDERTKVNLKVRLVMTDLILC
jgi:hypothetical protein